MVINVGMLRSGSDRYGKTHPRGDEAAEGLSGEGDLESTI